MDYTYTSVLNRHHKVSEKDCNAVVYVTKTVTQLMH